ncbi:LigA protein, partial [Kutzneria sp. 744]
MPGATRDGSHPPVSGEPASRRPVEGLDVPEVPASVLPGPPARRDAAPGRSATPVTRGPGEEVGQLSPERARPAASHDDIELPQVPTKPLVDKAAMRSRVPNISDLDRVLSEPEDHRPAGRPAEDMASHPEHTEPLSSDLHDRFEALRGDGPHLGPSDAGLTQRRTEFSTDPADDTVPDLPEVPVRPGAGSGHAETPSVREPGEEVGQLSSERARPAGSHDDVELPSAPTKPPVDKAALRSRVPDISDLDEALSDPAAHQAVHPAEDTAAHPERTEAPRFVPDPALARFAERAFDKLAEPAARKLWGEASRIVARHRTFDMTIGRSGDGMRERDPAQFWATMQVAQVLHENRDAPDRLERANAVAGSLADLPRVTSTAQPEQRPEADSPQPDKVAPKHREQGEPVESRQHDRSPRRDTDVAGQEPHANPTPVAAHPSHAGETPAPIPDAARPPTPTDWTERARVERPKVDGDIDGEPVRRAILDGLGLGDGPVDRTRAAMVRTQFSDENLKAMFHRAVDGGFVVDLGPSSRTAPQIRLEVASLGTPMHVTRATGDVTAGSSPEKSATTLANTRAAVFTEARNLRVPVVFAAVTAKVAGLFNARGSDLRSTVTHERATKVTETGSPGTRATHDVMFRVKVREPRKFPWSKDRTRSDVVPVEATLLWPDTHRPDPEQLPSAPLERPQEIVHAELSGIGDLYRQVEEELGGFPPSSEGARRLRDWLHGLPAQAPDLLGGKPATRSFKLPGSRRRIEVTVTVADVRASHAQADVTGTVEHVRRHTAESGAGTSVARRWGGGVGVVFGDIVNAHLGGGVGPIVLGYGSTKVETRNIAKLSHELTDTYHGPVLRQNVEFDFVVKVGDATRKVDVPDNGIAGDHNAPDGASHVDPSAVERRVPERTFRTSGSAIVWRTDPARHEQPDAVAEPETGAGEPAFPSTVDTSRLLDRIDAVHRLPAETLGHLVGSTLHRLSAEGLVKSKALPEIEARLRRFVEDNAGELARGGDGVRFPLSAWHSNAPDVFLRARPDVSRPRYLGEVVGATRTAKIGGGHEDAVQITKGTDISVGVTSFVYDNETAPTLDPQGHPVLDPQGNPKTHGVDSVGAGAPGIAYKGNVREVTDLKHESGRAHQLAAGAPLRRVRFPAEFEVRIGGRWSHPSEPVRLRDGSSFQGDV